MQYQSISVTFPKSHGNGPKNFAMAVRRPYSPRNTPQAPVKFKSFKEAMEYLKEKKQEEDEE